MGDHDRRESAVLDLEPLEIHVAAARPSAGARLAAGNAAMNRIAGGSVIDQEIAHAQTLLNSTYAADTMQSLRAIEHERIVDIDGEKIQVFSTAQADCVRRLVALIHSEFAVRLSDEDALAALRKNFPEVSAGEKAKVGTATFEFKEIVAIAMGLRFYAPLLGKRRDPARGEQEVMTIGKTSGSFERTVQATKAVTGTLGQAFATEHALLLTQTLTSDDGDYTEAVPGFKTTHQMELVGTVVHELAHLLLRDHIGAFITATGGYWIDEYQSDPSKGEAPMTPYGHTNAREDLCESVMYLALDPVMLAEHCPKRHAFLMKVVQSWTHKRR